MMKTLILTSVLAAAFALHARSQAPDAGAVKPQSPEAELVALDLSWHQAVAARDVEALGRLLAEDYRFDLDNRTRLTKAQELAAVGAPEQPFDFGAFKLDEVGVRVGGERATVSGVLTASPPGADRKARLRYFYVRTLARRDGRWQVVSSHMVSLAGR
jgi:ketosteroid isomerase-like protein